MKDSTEKIEEENITTLTMNDTLKNFEKLMAKEKFFNLLRESVTKKKEEKDGKNN